MWLVETREGPFMRAKLLIALFAATLGVAGGWFGGSRTQKTREQIANPQPIQLPESQSKNTEPKEQPTPQNKDNGKENPKSVSVPLAAIYGLSGQHDLKQLPINRYEDLRDEVVQIERRLEKFPVQALFVVRAVTINGAVSQTLSGLRGQNLTHEVSLTGDEGVEPLWCCVFLGNGSHTENWRIESITQTGSEVVIRYSTPQHISATATSYPHCYWFQLKDVRPGRLNIRLFDEGESPSAVVRAALKVAGVRSSDQPAHEATETLMVSFLIRP